LNPEEREIVNKLAHFQQTLEKSAWEYNPAHLAHYLYDLAESINSFYHKHQVLKAAPEDRDKRLALLDACAVVLKKGLALLGIEAVERM
jgi:arginyl-tRNA synthetase